MTISKPGRFLLTHISTASGIVTNLNNEILEYVNPEKPTHDHSSIYYKRFYTSRFSLGNQTIKATFSSPMVIANGDEVTVSGYPKGNGLLVLAYKNQTKQISHYENWLALVLGALLFFAVALGLLISEFLIEGALIPKLFLFGFTLVAIYMGYRALLIREAVKLIS